MADQKIIAVVFGGQSVEHDVSILSGLQFMEAMDTDRYQSLPLYVAPDGRWWTGDALRQRSFYPLSPDKEKKLTAVSFTLGRGKQAVLCEATSGLMGQRQKPLKLDLIVPAIHGTGGEDGGLQGLLEFGGIPYAGCSVLASAATMDKVFTKSVLGAEDVPVLPHLRLERPGPDAEPLGSAQLEGLLQEAFGSIDFPYIVKPQRLGSSVAVSKADHMDGLLASLISVFRLDASAIIEPFVPNLVEYNIAVLRESDGSPRLSAIERPLQDSEFLDFRDKYMAGDAGGPKLDSAPSEGMASQNRELEPEDLSTGQRRLIERCARQAFASFGLSGSVRIDFLSNRESGEIWFNEINSVPGSFSYYLWQAAKQPLSFTDLTSHMIEEGFRRARMARADTSSASGRSTIFDRG